jgi:adenine-specific DNA glycosylase
LQALMELGATVCTPKSPACGSCPLQHICAAYKQQQEWGQRQREIQKTAAREFFSSALAPSTAGDEEQMCVFLACVEI